MKVFIFDIDRKELEATISVVKKVLPDAEIHSFQNINNAFAYAQNNNVEIALIDTSANGMAAINILGMLQGMNPEVKIIFCNHVEHAQKKLPHHQKFYDNTFLKKPITEEIFRKIIDSIYSTLHIETFEE